MTTTEKAYIAGFLDGDGSIMLQLKPRTGMKFLFRVKALVIFYQNSAYIGTLRKLQNVIGAGYVYERNDRMSELRVEGFEQVRRLLLAIQPYIRFKVKQVRHMLAALTILQRKCDVGKFLEVCKLSDAISDCNYSSKRRKYSAQVVVDALRASNLIPVTTGSPLRGVKMADL